MLQKMDVKSKLTILVDAFHKSHGVSCSIRVTDLFRNVWTKHALEIAFYKPTCPAGFPPVFFTCNQPIHSIKLIFGVFNHRNLRSLNLPDHSINMPQIHSIKKEHPQNHFINQHVYRMQSATVQGTFTEDGKLMVSCRCSLEPIH